MNVLIDFDDSFTYNLKQYLFEIGLNIKVIHWKEFSTIDFNVVKIIILGPGPGHPHDYKDLRDTLKDILPSTDIKFLGVCLGHQIICDILGFEIDYLLTPIHGRSQIIKLHKKFQSFFCAKAIKGQFYNSLYVKPGLHKSFANDIIFQSFNKMIVILKSNNIFSMQFHPESIGSSSTLKGVKEFIK